ncbi:MAG: hypothetical protein LLH30_17505 [Candidatus Manganitrophus sp. SA1]|nr:hypothetical protein [Candidatus Manganitrophus morganii]
MPAGPNASSREDSVGDRSGSWSGEKAFIDRLERWRFSRNMVGRRGTLMRCADRAMYRAKQARSGYQIYQRLKKYRRCKPSGRMVISFL